MDKIYRLAVTYQVGISMALALTLFGLLAALFPGTTKAEELPEGLTFQQQMFGLVCGAPGQLKEELLRKHGEVPVVAGLLDSGTQWILYVSKDKNSISFVIHKSETEGCLIWSGSSELGQAFMLNPNPDFPAEDDKDSGWNISSRRVL